MRVVFFLIFSIFIASRGYSQKFGNLLIRDKIPFEFSYSDVHNYALNQNDGMCIVYVTNTGEDGKRVFKPADILFIDNLKHISDTNKTSIKIALLIVQWVYSDSTMDRKAYPVGCKNIPPINLISKETGTNRITLQDPMNGILIDSKFKSLCYVDTCSQYFRNHSSFLRPLLVKKDGAVNNTGSKEKKSENNLCFKPIEDIQLFLETLVIISELDRQKKTADTLSNEIQYLKKVNDSLSQRDSGLILQLAKNNSPFSIGLDADVQFFQQANIQSDYNLDLDKVRSNFVGFSLLYSKPISNMRMLSFAEVKLGVQFGTAQFRLQNNSIIYTVVASRIPDADGDYYDRYINMNKITEEVSLSSNRMTLGMNYIFTGRRNSRLRYKIGFQVGTDLRTTVNYKISNGTWSYSAFYPQYNSFDTVFSALYDFNKPGSSNEKSYTFQNSMNNLLVSFGGSAMLGFKKVRMFSNIKTFNYRYNIIGGIYFNRWYQSFSAKDFNSSFPTYFYSKYNSFLFRTDRIVLNQLSISLGLTYTL